MDDYYGRKLYFWAVVGAVICVFQYSASAGGYYSFGKSVNKSFGDANEKTMLTENIFVPIGGKVLDVDLALNIEHPSICDLEICLLSPSGVGACINSYDVHTFVKSRANFYWTIFDAESPFSIDSGKPPYTGLYRPNGPDSLTDFYNQQSFGTWQVRVYDGVRNDTGTFKGARLDFHINPEPSIILLFGVSAAIGISLGKSRPV
jgi:subtilisin-like proprotein convertase family protein